MLCCGKCRANPDSGTVRAGEGGKAISDLFFRFELLEILSFDSVRRRMSVIVKSVTGRNVFFLRVFELHVVAVLLSCLPVWELEDPTACSV